MTPRWATGPGTTSAYGWPDPRAVVVTRPVTFSTNLCPLPHTCPTCGTSWEPTPEPATTEEASGAV